MSWALERAYTRPDLLGMESRLEVLMRKSEKDGAWKLSIVGCAVRVGGQEVEAEMGLVLAVVKDCACTRNRTAQPRVR